MFSSLNNWIGPQACNLIKKRLQHRGFPVNFANFKNTYFEKHLQTADSDASYILHTKLNKIIQEAGWPSRLAFCFSWIVKSLCFTYFHSHWFVLSLAVLCCHWLSFFVTRCHSLSLAAPLVVTRCTTRCHSLSLVVIRCTTCFHSLSLVVIRCHWMYHSSVFFKRSLFHKVLLFTSFIIKTKKILILKF